MVMSIGVGLTQTLLLSRQPRVIGLPQSRQEARARDSTGRLRGGQGSGRSTDFGCSAIHAWRMRFVKARDRR
jgi:hypothetical protein